MIDRGEARREIAQRVTERVNRAAPKGVGHWAPSWDLVGPASERFLDALDAWVHQDTGETRSRVNSAAKELEDSWRLAGLLWDLVRAREPDRETAHV